MARHQGGKLFRMAELVLVMQLVSRQDRQDQSYNEDMSFCSGYHSSTFFSLNGLIISSEERCQKAERKHRRRSERKRKTSCMLPEEYGMNGA